MSNAINSGVAGDDTSGGGTPAAAGSGTAGATASTATSARDFMDQFLSSLRLVGNLSEQSQREVEQIQQQLAQNEREMKRSRVDVQLRQDSMVEREKRQKISEQILDQPQNNNSVVVVPPELKMSPEELEWAWDLKAAYTHHQQNSLEMKDTNNNPERSSSGNWQIQKITDFEIAQFALILQGDDTEKAIQQISAIRKFKMKYWINDTVEQGMEAIEEFVRLQPGYLLSVDVKTDAHHKGSMLAVDNSKFFPHVVSSSPENMRNHMLFCYYINQLCAPNLDAARGGLRFLIDNAGFSLRNVDQALEQQAYSEYWDHAPVKHNEVRLYNTNPVFNGFFELLKPFLPRNVREVLSIGCQISQQANGFLNSLWPLTGRPLATLASLLLVPDYNRAMANLIPKARKLLEERYNNERSFRLYSRANDDDDD